MTLHILFFHSSSERSVTTRKRRCLYMYIFLNYHTFIKVRMWNNTEGRKIYIFSKSTRWCFLFCAIGDHQIIATSNSSSFLQFQGKKRGKKTFLYLEKNPEIDFFSIWNQIKSRSSSSSSFLKIPFYC